ncbi:MAG: ABC transporter substrate-binding protein [Gallionellaceae bacterium]|nr:ABC transporter substrate-binding protein [Gallionellaceae bacterium]
MAHPVATPTSGAQSKALSSFISAAFLCAGFLLHAGLAQGAESVVLQLRWLHQFQFAGYYAALEKGYYAREGLNVAIREAGPHRPTPLDEVLNGHAQYGVGNSGLVAAYQRGRPVVALAALFQRSPNIWLVLEKSGIHTPQDLASRRLMMTRSVENAELLVLLSNEGVRIDHLNLIPSSFNVQDLIDGKADAFNAYSSNEPYFLKQRGISYRIIDPHSYGVDFYSDVLFTSQDELRVHPERVAAFRRASMAGWDYALAHPEEIVDLILARYSRAKSREHLLFEAQAIRALMQPDLIEVGHMNPGRWKRIETAYANLGLSETTRTLDDFLYRSPRSDWRWLIWTSVVLALTTLVAALIALMVGRFNRQLRREVADKEIARAALNDANQIFFNVLEGVDVALYVVDAASLKVMFANASARNQFGDLLGQTCHQALLDRLEPCSNCVPEAQTPVREAMLGVPPCVGSDFDFPHPATGRWYHVSNRQARWLDGRAVLVGAAVDITGRKQRENEQEWLANHDPLTALPNRSLLADRLKSTLALARRGQSLVGVLFLDLDGFKPVNDRYGHAVGDELLEGLARRLESRLRGSDTLARLGGDEFVMVVAISRCEELREIVHRLADDLHEPITLSEGVVQIDGSIGIAVYPRDGDSADALLRQADEAMYAVKRAGRGGYAMRATPDALLTVTHWRR